MENLIKQLRVRNTSLEQDKDLNSVVERRAAKRTGSSTSEKRTQNWFWRQMSREADDSEDEFKTAVAAAVYAIHTLEELRTDNKQRQSLGNGTKLPLSKSKSRKDDKQDPSDSSKTLSRWFTDKGEPSFKKPDQPNKKTEKAPSAKKTVSFSKNNSFDRDRVKSENTSQKLKDTSATQSTVLPTESQKKDITPKQTSKTESKPDAWEKEQMAKIEKRYEKMKSTIQTWESEKKKKARLHYDKKESELERRRARASRIYNIEISRINKVAKEARALADEKKRNDEAGMREKARKYRARNGKPPKFFCF